MTPQKQTITFNTASLVNDLTLLEQLINSVCMVTTTHGPRGLSLSELQCYAQALSNVGNLAVYGRKCWDEQAAVEMPAPPPTLKIADALEPSKALPSKAEKKK